MPLDSYLIRMVFALLPWGLVVWAISPRIRETVVGRGPTSKTHVPCLLALMALVAVFVCLHRLGCRVPEAETHNLERSGILEADVGRVAGSLTGSGTGTYRTSVHPLQCLLFQPLGFTFRSLTNESPLRAAQLTCCLTLTLSVALLYLTVWLFGGGWALALAGAALYTISFSVLFHVGVPESAGCSAPTVILPFLLAALFHEQPGSRRETVAFVAAGVLAIGGTLTNIVVALIAYAFRRRDAGRSWTRALGDTLCYASLVLLVSVALAFVQMRLYPGSALFFMPAALQEESAYSHNVSFSRAASTLVQMLGYAIVGPRFTAHTAILSVGVLEPQISAEQVRLTSLPCLSLVLLTGAMVGVVGALITTWHKAYARSVAAALLFMVVLHLFYGNEFLLYSGNWTVLLCLLIVLAFDTWRHFRFGPVLLAMLLGVLAVNNVGAFANLTDSIYRWGKPYLHLPVGFPERPESSLIFVDETGGISPGVGSCGLHFVLWDPATHETSLSQAVLRRAQHSLRDGWLPIPVMRVCVGDLHLEQEVFRGPEEQAAIRVRVRAQSASTSHRARLYVVISGAGPAGNRAEISPTYSLDQQTLLLDGQSLLNCATAPTGVIRQSLRSQGFRCAQNGVTDVASLSGEEFFPIRLMGQVRRQLVPQADPGPAGQQLVALYYDCDIPPGQEREYWFLSPLSRRIASGPSQDAQHVAEETLRYWNGRFADLRFQVPDPDWSQAFKASVAHVATLVQEGGRPVVAPVNYVPFVRDAVYMVYALLVAGQNDLAREAIGYLLREPWTGRPYAEADSPGELLWIMGRYWAYTHDAAWLTKAVPSILQLTNAIEQLRSMGQSPVWVTLLGQTRRVQNGEGLDNLRKTSPQQRLPCVNYGAMDGNGLLYVNFFSLAGLHEAQLLLKAAGRTADASRVQGRLHEYRQAVEALLHLAGNRVNWDDRGQCNALWPCRAFPLKSSRSWFGNEEAWRKFSKWRYLDLDEAHNYLMLDQREMANQALQRQLQERSFREWRVLDEGGPSDVGYWEALRTEPPWTPTVAVPHGWSLASLTLLLRDSLVFEYDGKCYLMSGVPDNWFKPGARMGFRLPTEFGMLDCRVEATDKGVSLHLGPGCRPPAGFVLRLPSTFPTHELFFPAGAGVDGAVAFAPRN